MVYEAPSVFSFFRPEFAPPGSLAGVTGLVAPEAEILTAASAVEFINAMGSLGKWGLTSNQGGFGDNDDIDAIMTLELPPDELMDRLDLLLTNGRLSDESRSTISTGYKKVLEEEESTDRAMRYALQLFFASPEFQISNSHKSLPSSSDVTSNAASVVTRKGTASKAPKAVVYVFLEGGADSYNMLVSA